MRYACREAWCSAAMCEGDILIFEKQIQLAVYSTTVLRNRGPYHSSVRRRERPGRKVGKGVPRVGEGVEGPFLSSPGCRAK